MDMKKLVLVGVLLVSAMALPCQASLLDVQTGPSVRTVCYLRINPSKLPSDQPASQVVAAKPAPKTDLLLSMNYFPLVQNRLLATTELKINLDNFDMEYVLKVQ